MRSQTAGHVRQNDVMGAETCRRPSSRLGKDCLFGRNQATPLRYQVCNTIVIPFDSLCILLYIYRSNPAQPPPTPSPLLLKFINIPLPIPQLLQHTIQLPLILRTLLRPANRLIQPRRPTHKDLALPLRNLFWLR